MPNSRKRHKHQNHQIQHHVKKDKGRASLVLMVIIGVFGLLIGGFASEANILWIFVCALIGAFTGYLIGRNMDRSLSSK